MNLLAAMTGAAPMAPLPASKFTDPRLPPQSFEINVSLAQRLKLDNKLQDYRREIRSQVQEATTP